MLKLIQPFMGRLVKISIVLVVYIFANQKVQCKSLYATSSFTLFYLIGNQLAGIHSHEGSSAITTVENSYFDKFSDGQTTTDKRSSSDSPNKNLLNNSAKDKTDSTKNWNKILKTLNEKFSEYEIQKHILMNNNLSREKDDEKLKKNFFARVCQVQYQ